MAQVTKPMALDETLQDVVTALQNITQGGHIVYSGTVGSTTQPIYFNAGVPTEISAVDVIAEGTAIASQSDLDNLVKSVMLDHKTRFFRVFNSTIGTMFSYGGQTYKYGFGQLSTSYVASTSNNIIMLHFVGFAGNYATRTFMYACSHDGTTATYTRKGISADVTDKDIQTGTISNLNSSLSQLTNSEIHKSGNIVVVNLILYTSAAITGDVAICTLPWKPTKPKTLTRFTGAGENTGTHYVNGCVLGTDGVITLGFGPYDGLGSSRILIITGTYLTND